MALSWHAHAVTNLIMQSAPAPVSKGVGCNSLHLHCDSHVGIAMSEIVAAVS